MNVFVVVSLLLSSVYESVEDLGMVEDVVKRVLE